MARVATPGYDISYTLGGIDDSMQTRTYHSTAVDETEAIAQMGALATDLALISGGTIKSTSYTKRYVEDAYVRPLVATAEKGDAAIITGEIDGNPLKKWNLSVPFPVEGIFLAGIATGGENYNVVDITDANLLAFLANFQAGGTFTLSDGEVAGAIIKGRRA